MVFPENMPASPPRYRSRFGVIRNDFDSAVVFYGWRTQIESHQSLMMRMQKLSANNLNIYDPELFGGIQSAIDSDIVRYIHEIIMSM